MEKMGIRRPIKESDIISQYTKTALNKLADLFRDASFGVGDFILTRPTPKPEHCPGDFTLYPQLDGSKKNINCRNCGYNSHESICPACAT